MAVNILDFAFDVMKGEVGEVAAVEDGVLVYGMWMECCRWDDEEEAICDAREGEVVYKCPVLHLLPDEDHVVGVEDYVCPVYKTSERSGVVGTTGVHSNFVFAVELPMRRGRGAGENAGEGGLGLGDEKEKEKDADFWILRSASMLLSLND